MPEIAKLNEQVHTLFANDERVTRDMDALRRDVQDAATFASAIGFTFA